MIREIILGIKDEIEAAEARLKELEASVDSQKKYIDTLKGKVDEIRLEAIRKMKESSQ
jgi:uncharacterized coiled-coil protein SlyX